MSLIIDRNGANISLDSPMEGIKEAVSLSRSDRQVKDAFNSYGVIDSEVNNRPFKSYKDLNPHSFVEEHELEENKKLIKEHLGFEPPRVVGFNMCVKIYVRPNEIVTSKGEDGVVRKFYLPDSVTAHDRFRSCVALVCAQGNECYTAPQFQGIRWCNVGDWIVIPRNEGIQINYRGVPMQFIQDINMYAVVEDPTYVTRD